MRGMNKLRIITKDGKTLYRYGGGMYQNDIWQHSKQGGFDREHKEFCDNIESFTVVKERKESLDEYDRKQKITKTQHKEEDREL